MSSRGSFHSPVPRVPSEGAGLGGVGAVGVCVLVGGAVCSSDCLKARTGSGQHAPLQRWATRLAERPGVARGSRPVGSCARSLNTEAGGKPKAMSRTWAAEQCHGGLLVDCYIIVVSLGRVLRDRQSGLSYDSSPLVPQYLFIGRLLHVHLTNL